MVPNKQAASDDGRPVAISYREAQLSDLPVLLRIHNHIFPTKCEPDFFRNAVMGHDALSWVVAHNNTSDGGDEDQVIGFISAQTLPAKQSEIADQLAASSSDSAQSVIFILILGVVEKYRNLGIASRLMHQVLEHASKFPTCRAAYLHVESHNDPAIQLYKKLSFKCMRRLKDYYDKNGNGQRQDAYLFVRYFSLKQELAANSMHCTQKQTYMI